MRGKISHQGGLQFHESEIEMGLPQGNFFPLPKSFQTTPVTHPRRVLPSLRLQPQIRHPTAAWSSPTKNQDPPQNSAPDLRCEHDLGSSGHLGGGWLPLLGPHQGPFTSVAAVGRQALGSVGPNPRATLVDQSRLPSTADSSPKSANSKNDSTVAPNPVPCSNTISPSKPTPGMSKPQALPKPIWSLTRETRPRASSFTRSTLPTFTLPGWKPERSWAKVRSAYSML